MCGDRVWYTYGPKCISATRIRLSSYVRSAPGQYRDVTLVYMYTAVKAGVGEFNHLAETGPLEKKLGELISANGADVLGIFQGPGLSFPVFPRLKLNFRAILAVAQYAPQWNTTTVRLAPHAVPSFVLGGADDDLAPLVSCDADVNSTWLGSWSRELRVTDILLAGVSKL